MLEIDILNELGEGHWYLRNKYEMMASLCSTLPAGSKVLEVGCGPGFLSLELQSMGFNLTAIDRDPRAVEYAKKRGVASVIPMDASQTSFKDEAFDAVIFSDVLEHIPNQSAFLNEIHRILKSDGRIIFSVPAEKKLWSRHDISLGHYRRYSRQDVVTLLENHGFRIRKLRYWNSFLYPLILIHRRLFKTADMHDLRRLGFLNPLLYHVLRLEIYLPFLPFGTSLVGAATKKNLRGRPQ